MIRKALEESHPPTTVEEPGWLETIQERLMKGEMEAWVGMNAEGVPAVLAVTEVVVEPGAMQRNLLIYSLCRIGDVDDGAWHRWAEKVRQMCIAGGMKKVVAYTCIPEVVHFAQRVLGAKAEYTLLEWEVQSDG